jgi:plastocyanin
MQISQNSVRAVLSAVRACLVLAAFTCSPAFAADTAAVKIDNFTFNPQVLTIRAGTTVTFTNSDDIPHTVVAKDKAFRSKTLDTDDTFTFTFTTPGSFAYFCSLHPHMTGTIVVEAAAQ